MCHERLPGCFQGGLVASGDTEPESALSTMSLVVPRAHPGGIACSSSPHPRRDRWHGPPTGTRRWLPSACELLGTALAHTRFRKDLSWFAG
jgi:hypothetical protein